MEEVMNEAIDYLQKAKDTNYDVFVKSNPIEEDIPGAKKAITNLVIRNHSIIAKANRSIRHKLIPQLRQTAGLLNPYTLEDYENYFDNEHACLVWIRKMLKSKKSTMDDLQMSRCCGILTQCLLRANTENKDKLIKLINASQTTYYYGISAMIYREWEIPSNETLIKSMSYTLGKTYRNAK